jgi:hypothetical protein
VCLHVTTAGYRRLLQTDITCVALIVEPSSQGLAAPPDGPVNTSRQQGSQVVSASWLSMWQQGMQDRQGHVSYVLLAFPYYHTQHTVMSACQAACSVHAYVMAAVLTSADICQWFVPMSGMCNACC